MSWASLNESLANYVAPQADSNMLDVEALIAVADEASARSTSGLGAAVFDIEACALALAIERLHDARETFAGLAALNARLLALCGADTHWPPAPVHAACDNDSRLDTGWQLILGNGLALAALYTPGELKTRVAICDDLHRRVVFASRPQNSATSLARIERLRLRVATTLLAYADLRDSSTVHAELEAVASEAAARLPPGALEHTRWLAERLLIVMFRIFREPDGAARALQLGHELTQRLKQFPDPVSAFKLSRARVDTLRAQGDAAAAQENLQECERAQRMLGPRKRTTLVTLLRLRGTCAMMKALPREAERHYKEAVELAQVIDAPATHISNLLMFLGGALSEQQRYGDAATTLVEIETRTAPQQAELVRPRRQIYEFLARWDVDRTGALASLRAAMTTFRETQVYQFLGPSLDLAARVCATALEHDIETAFVTAAIQQRDLAPPSRACTSWPWVLRLNLFGGFEMLGETVSPRRGKAQQKPVAVLQALALLGPRGGDRRALARRVYGSGDLDAPATLDMAIARCRKLVGDDSLIVFQDGRIRLDERRVFVDVWAFDALDAEIGRVTDLEAPNGHDLASMSRALTALYAGRLLEADASDVASANLVQQYRERFVTNAIRLARTLALSGAVSQATDLLHRAIEREADSEVLYRALIEILIEAREDAEAMRWYQRCKTFVEDGIGVALSQRTTQLLDRISRRPRDARDGKISTVE